MAKSSKRARGNSAKVVPGKALPLDAAVKVLKSSANAKFDETIEIAVNLGVDPRHSDQNVRGVVELPHGSGKSARVAVFAKGAKAEEALKAGADLVGGDDLAEKINAGEMGFERVIATPDMMPVVGRLGKVLGPRGLMPNPKLGTVTMDVTGAIRAAKAGQVQFRAEKAGIVHAGIGKASFSAAKIEENVRAFVEAIAKARPSGAKGIYIKKVAIASTMGPGLSLDLEGLPTGGGARATE